MKLMLVYLMSFGWIIFSFASDDIRNPILPEKLAHPPRLEKCMRDLLAPIKVRGFSGPYHAKNNMVAAYRVISEAGGYEWYFQATGESGWRFFTYETSTGTAIGMFARSLSLLSKLVDVATGETIGKIDLSACSQFLGKP